MADERKRCPKCGADFDHMVCDGEVRQFKCGTLQGRTRTERVIESEECLRRQLAQAQARLAQAQAMIEQLRDALRAALEWIDAVPKDVALPAMPGFDRDWAESLLVDADECDGRENVDDGF